MNQHFESMKETWRNESKKEFEEEKEQQDEVCRQLKFELEETRSELDDVKELYVKACNEKDELEDQLNKEWDEKLTQDLERVCRNVLYCLNASALKVSQLKCLLQEANIMIR